MSMRLELSSKLCIYNPTDAVRDWAQENLRVLNPDYANRVRMGLYLGRTPKYLSLYTERPEGICIPYGAWKDANFTRLLKGRLIRDKFAPHEKVNYNADIPLRGYQEDAVNALVARGCGILQSKAGSGKTRCGVAAVCRLGAKSLWLTHTQELLEQSYNAAAEFVDKSLLGKITKGKVHIGAGITFATVQTMCKLDLSEYRDEWECVVVDECHRVAGTPTRVTMFSKILNSLNAKHKYGLSATLHRSDGLIKCALYMLGGVAHTVPDSVVNVMSAQILKRRTSVRAIPWEALDSDGIINYARLINAIATNRERNLMIARDITDNIHHSNMLLSDRKVQLSEIYDLLPAAIQNKTAVMHAEVKHKDRQEILRKAREGEISCVLATYSLAKEGLDIPRLDRLYLGTPVKDYAIVAQAVGRITRTCEGKGQPVVYDYVDDVSYFEKMFRQRARHYRKSGCKL